ncbi:hypothetical protein DIPPA_02283 [Diplonema papillatum]|nr:hypothetical protein DIPPA_02283 [Diplonema papillatum]
MATEVEVLRSRVTEQDRQINVLRAALAGREDLLRLPQDGSVDASWVRQFKKQLKEQAAAEMRAAACGRHAGAAADAAADGEADSDEQSFFGDLNRPPGRPLKPAPQQPVDTSRPSARTKIRKPPPGADLWDADTGVVAVVQEKTPDGSANDKQASGAVAWRLIATTKQLVSVWQDALRERFEGLVRQLFSSFAAYKQRPRDEGLLQRFLATVNSLQQQADVLLSDTDASFAGADGNPFETDFEHLLAYYSQEISSCSSAAEARAAEEHLSKQDQLEEALRRANAELAGASRSLEGIQQSLHAKAADLLHSQEVAQKLAREVEDLRYQATQPAQAALREASQRPGSPAHGAFSPVAFSSYPSSQTPSTPCSLPPAAGSEARVKELRATLGHLEARLSSCCIGSSGSEQRMGHITRRMERARVALAKEESAFFAKQPR